MLSRLRSWVRSYRTVRRASKLDTEEIVLLAIVRDYEEAYGEPISYWELTKYGAVVAPDRFDWGVVREYEPDGSVDIDSGEFLDWVVGVEEDGYLRRDSTKGYVVTEKAERVLDLVEERTGDITVFETIGVGNVEETAKRAIERDQ